MIKRKSTISINIISALIILISLFFGIVGNTNAWFTSIHQNGVQMIINVGDIKLKLYQVFSPTSKVELTTYDDTISEKQYITLNDELSPDTPISLKLELENNEPGSAPMYVKFKFELFARGVDSDTPIDVKLNDGEFWQNGVAGFKLSENGDGFYYYKAADGQTNGLFPYNDSAILMKSFTIDSSSMYDDAGELKFTSCEMVYIKLTIDASMTDFTTVN